MLKSKQIMERQTMHNFIQRNLPALKAQERMCSTQNNEAFCAENAPILWSGATREN